MPFGISSAPSIFQRVLENVLKGIPGVDNYLDDSLVIGATGAEHAERLEEVFQRLENAGFRLRKDKCAFMVTYLGHVIDDRGIHPDPDKVKAIKEAQAPCNLQELRSFWD